MKAARLARSHLGDKVKLSHQTLHTLLFISFWILKRSVHVSFSLTQTSQHHSNAQPIIDKDFEIPHLDLMSSLQSVLKSFLAHLLLGHCTETPIILSIIFQKGLQSSACLSRQAKLSNRADIIQLKSTLLQQFYHIIKHQKGLTFYKNYRK